MTCPDWPLCRGAVVPALYGGIVLEWSHRAIALVISFLVVAMLLAGWRIRERIAGISALLGLLGAALVLQIGLGGVTIRYANSPLSVMLHWGAAMLLLAVLTSLAVLSVRQPKPGSVKLKPASVALLGAAGCGLVAMCLGAFVSSSGFGLACVVFQAAMNRRRSVQPARNFCRWRIGSRRRSSCWQSRRRRGLPAGAVRARAGAWPGWR